MVSQDEKWQQFDLTYSCLIWNSDNMFELYDNKFWNNILFSSVPYYASEEQWVCFKMK